jgi:hypothetical protein
MNKYIFYLGIALSINVNAQDLAQLKGKLLEDDGKTGLVGANVQLILVKDTTVQKLTSTMADGSFEFKGIIPSFYKIKYSSLGYTDGQKLVRVKAPETILEPFIIAEEAEILSEIEVKGKSLSVENKGDTTAILASGFKVNQDANAEDLIAKMPGIIVNGSGVQAQGEQVQKVLVDGREFFANDPNIALKNIPAEIVEKIEVFDQQSEQAQFSGFDDGNTTKTINIVTKLENRNGQFGRLYAGANLDNQYSTGGNINHFEDALRLSLVGMSNNINKQNFTSDDLLGVASASSRRGGRGGGPGGMGGGSESFLTNQANGISETHAYGLNYSDEWGEKVRITGSYFFNLKDNINNQLVNRENFVPELSNQFYNEISESINTNQNHRANMRLIYSINSNNTLMFMPNISWQKTQLNDLLLGSTSTLEGATLNNIANDYNSIANGYSLSGNLIYMHRFEQRGRTISLRLGANSNEGYTDDYLDNLTIYSSQTAPNDTILQFGDSYTNGSSYSANLNYTEPIADRVQLQFDYRAEVSDDDADRKTFDDTEIPAALDTALTNVFDSRYITNAPSLGLFARGDKMFLRAAVMYQWATLDSRQQFPQEAGVNRNFNQVLPMAMMRYRFSRDANLRVFYRSFTQKPTINQLQNVVDNSNPLYISIGNPALDQSTSHMVNARYSRVNAKQASSFFVLASLTSINAYVTNSSLVVNQDSLINGEYLLRAGGQISTPVNLSGFLNTRLLFNYGVPLSFIKTNLNINAGATYIKIPGLVNNISNISRNIAYNGSIGLSSNISEKIDYTLLYDITYNDVINDLESNLSEDYTYQSLGLKLNWSFWNDFIFRSQLSYQQYNGFSENFNEEFTLWNMSLAKKFLKEKQAEIEFRVYDLLNQNTAIARVNKESYIEETRTNVLQQYFMLSFTYTISNFKGVVDRSNQDRGPGRW